MDESTAEAGERSNFPPILFSASLRFTSIHGGWREKTLPAFFSLHRPTMRLESGKNWPRSPFPAPYGAFAGLLTPRYDPPQPDKLLAVK